MRATSIRLNRRIFINQGRSRFWDTKSVFIILLGYVIGNLISEYFDNNAVKIAEKIYDLFNHKSNIEQHNQFAAPKSSELFGEVKILCWVMTNPSDHKKTTHILKTWGKRCNKILLTSFKENDKSDEIIVLPGGEGKNNLLNRTKEAFSYIYDLYFDEYDWFLKADDDTYVIVENLRLLLYDYNPMTPIFFGYKFSPFVNQAKISGKGGYVLSKKALKRFVDIAVPNPILCQSNDQYVAEIGQCLKYIGVVAGDSRDKNKRGRFFMSSPEYHLLAFDIDPHFWFWQQTKDGLTCCSDYAISFHEVSPKLMYILDYFIYNATPYGIVNKRKMLSSKNSIDPNY